MGNEDAGSRAASTGTRTGLCVLCPGQGAQAVGMGRRWRESSDAARAIFDEADRVLNEFDIWPDDRPRLSQICFDGPPALLNRTDVSQPAIYTCSVASWHGLIEQGAIERPPHIVAAAGLSLGEYTALHLGHVFDFATGLRLVTTRGMLMQDAAEDSEGGMVALIGADEAQAQEICDTASGDWVLVCANFTAPGQIVLSGAHSACQRAVEAAEKMGLRAKELPVAGAFHSPLMEHAAEAFHDTLSDTEFAPPAIEIWSNVTAEPHDPEDPELLKRRLVEQLVQPVRWAQLCENMVKQHPAGDTMEYHEPAPGTINKGLMRRINRQTKVISHDEPT